MNEKQRRGMIEFHKKAEAAYIKYGRTDKADQARKMRETLESENSEK